MDVEHRLVELWPLFGLRLRIADVELRLPSDADLARLADVSVGGVHPPERTPFASAWTDAPREELPERLLRHAWSTRAQQSPERWVLDFVVVRGGVVQGVQALHADDFRHRRSVSSGSWLGMPYQGRGTGTLMRTAVLALAFDHLGAVEARSGAFVDNPASAAVSRRLGYVEDGTAMHSPRGEPVVEQRYRMTVARWRERDRPAVEVEGLDACREVLGLAEPRTADASD